MFKLKWYKVPFCLEWGEWEIWHKETKSKFPIQYMIRCTIPLFWGRFCFKINSVYWWFQHRFNPRHRYHIVDTGLEPGYYDKDDLIIHACFNLLKLYIEREKPEELLDISEEEWFKEARRLYNWWNIERPQRDGSKPYGEYDNEDEQNLIRLIKIRLYLWT